MAKYIGDFLLFFPMVSTGAVLPALVPLLMTEEEAQYLSRAEIIDRTLLIKIIEERYILVKKLLEEASVTIDVKKEDKMFQEWLNFLVKELRSAGYNVQRKVLEEKKEKIKLKIYLCCTRCGNELKPKQRWFCEECKSGEIATGALVLLFTILLIPAMFIHGLLDHLGHPLAGDLVITLIPLGLVFWSVLFSIKYL